MQPRVPALFQSMSKRSDVILWHSPASSGSAARQVEVCSIVARRHLKYWSRLKSVASLPLCLNRTSSRIWICQLGFRLAFVTFLVQQDLKLPCATFLELDLRG